MNQTNFPKPIKNVIKCAKIMSRFLNLYKKFKGKAYIIYMVFVWSLQIETKIYTKTFI